MNFNNEIGYMSLLAYVRKYGQDIPDRTGVGCRAIFDAKLTWDRFPFWTHRPAISV